METVRQASNRSVLKASGASDERVSERTNASALARQQSGAVFVEKLVAYLPVLLFFFATWQIGEMLVAKLVLTRASSAAARAAAVVLPDDPLFYDSVPVHIYDGKRRDDIKLATAMILAASPHFDENFDVEVGDIPIGFGGLEISVSANFHCSILPLACGTDGVVPMKQKIVQPYHGAAYKYEFGGCAFDDPCGGVIDMYDQFGPGWTAAGVAGLYGTQYLQGGGNQCAAGNGGNANPPSGSTGPLPGRGPTGPGTTPGGSGPGSFTPGGGGTPPGRGITPGGTPPKVDPVTPPKIDPVTPPKIDPVTPPKINPGDSPPKNDPTTSPGKTDPAGSPPKNDPGASPGKTDPTGNPPKNDPGASPGKTDPGVASNGKTPPGGATPPKATPTNTSPNTASNPVKTAPGSDPAHTRPAAPSPGKLDPGIGPHGKPDPGGATPPKTTPNAVPPHLDPAGSGPINTTPRGTPPHLDPTPSGPINTPPHGTPIDADPAGSNPNKVTPGGTAPQLDPIGSNPNNTTNGGALPHSDPGGSKPFSGNTVDPTSPGSGTTPRPGITPPLGSGRPDPTVVRSDLSRPGDPLPGGGAINKTTGSDKDTNVRGPVGGDKDLPPGTGRPSRTFVQTPTRPDGEGNPLPGGSSRDGSERSTDQLGQDVDGNPIDPGRDVEGDVSQGNEPDYEAHSTGDNPGVTDGGSGKTGDGSSSKGANSPDHLSADPSDASDHGGNSPDADAKKGKDGGKDAGKDNGGADKDKTPASSPIASSFKDQICTFCADSGRPHRELFSAFQQTGSQKTPSADSDLLANAPAFVRPDPAQKPNESPTSSTANVPSVQVHPSSRRPDTGGDRDPYGVASPGNKSDQDGPRGIFGAPSSSSLRGVAPGQVNTKIGSSNCGFCSVAGTLPDRISSSELARRVQMKEGRLTPTDLITVMLKVKSGDGRFSLHTHWGDAQSFMQRYPDGTPDRAGNPTEPTVFIVSYNPPNGGLGHDLTAEFSNGKITFRDYQNLGAEFVQPNAHMLAANGGFIQITPVNNAKTGPGQDNTIGPVLNEGDLSQAAKDHFADLLLEADADGTKPTYDDLLLAYFDAYDARNRPGPLGASPTPPPQASPPTSAPTQNRTFDDILADIGHNPGRAENDNSSTEAPKTSFFKNLFKRKPKASSGKTDVAIPTPSESNASRQEPARGDAPPPFGANEKDSSSDQLKKLEAFRDFLLTRKDALNDSGGRINGRNLNSGDLSNYLRNCNFATIAGTLPRKITSSEAARIANMKEVGAHQFDIITAMLRNGSGDGRVAYHTDWTTTQDFMKSYPGGRKTSDGSVESTKFVVAYFDPKRGEGHTIAGKVKDGNLTFRDYQDSGFKFHTPDAAMNDALSNGGYVMVAPVNNFTPVRPGEGPILNEKDLTGAQKDRIGNLVFKPNPDRPPTFDRIKNGLKLAKIQGIPRLDTGVSNKSTSADPSGPSSTSKDADPDSSTSSSPTEPPNAQDPFADPDSSTSSSPTDPSNAQDPFADPDSPTSPAPTDRSSSQDPFADLDGSVPSSPASNDNPFADPDSSAPPSPIADSSSPQNPFSDPTRPSSPTDENPFAGPDTSTASTPNADASAPRPVVFAGPAALSPSGDGAPAPITGKTVNTGRPGICGSNCGFNAIAGANHPKITSSDAARRAQLLEGSTDARTLTIAMIRNGLGDGRSGVFPNWASAQKFMTSSNVPSGTRFVISAHKLGTEGHAFNAKWKDGNLTYRDYQAGGRKSDAPDARYADGTAIRIFPTNNHDAFPQDPGTEVFINANDLSDAEKSTIGSTLYQGRDPFGRYLADAAQGQKEAPDYNPSRQEVPATFDDIFNDWKGRPGGENAVAPTKQPSSGDNSFRKKLSAWKQKWSRSKPDTSAGPSGVRENTTGSGHRPQEAGVDSLRQRIARNSKYATFSARRAFTMARHGGRISAKSVNSGNRFNYQNNCSFASVAGSLSTKLTSSEVARRAQMVEGSLSAKDLITTMLRNGAGDGRTSAHTTWNDAQTFMRGYPSGTKFIVSYYHRPTADGGIAHSISGKFKNGTVTFRDYQQRGKKDRTPNPHMNAAIAILVTPVNNTHAGPPALPGQDAVINATSLSAAQKDQLLEGFYLPDPANPNHLPPFSDFLQSIRQGQRNAQNHPSSSVSSSNSSLRPMISRRGSNLSTLSLSNSSDNTSTRAVISRRNSDASTLSRSSDSDNASTRAIYSLPNVDIAAPDSSPDAASDNASTRAIKSRRNSDASNSDTAASSNDSFVTAKTSPDGDASGSRPSSPDPFADFDGVHFVENGGADSRPAHASGNPHANQNNAPTSDGVGRPDTMPDALKRFSSRFAATFAKRARRTESNIIREARETGLTDAHAQALIDKMNGDQDSSHARVIAGQVEKKSETLVSQLNEADRRNALQAVANYVTSHKSLQDNANITPDDPSVAVQNLDKALADLHRSLDGNELNVVYRSVTYEDPSNIPYGQLVSKEERKIEGYDSKLNGYRIDEGDFVSDPGFLSTSEHRQFVLTKEQNAQNRVKPTLKLAIVGKTGTPIAFDPSEGSANILPYLNRTESRRYSMGPDGRGLTLTRRLSDRISGQGPRPGQAEVLFPRNTIFQVRKIQKDGNLVSVVLEEVSTTSGAEIKRLEYGTARSLNRAQLRSKLTAPASPVPPPDSTEKTSNSKAASDVDAITPVAPQTDPGASSHEKTDQGATSDSQAQQRLTSGIPTPAGKSKRSLKNLLRLPRAGVEKAIVAQAQREGGLSDQSAQKLITKMMSDVAADKAPQSGDAKYSKFESKLSDEVTSNLKFTAIDPRGKRAQKALHSLDVEGWDQFRRVDEAIQKTQQASSKSEGQVVYHSDPATNALVYETSIQAGDYVGRGDYQYFSTLYDGSASVHVAIYTKSGVPLPKNSWDRQFIFPRNTFFQIKKIERSQDKIFVVAEESSGPRPNTVKDLSSGKALALPSGQRFQEWLALTKAKLAAIRKGDSSSHLPDPSTRGSDSEGDPTRAPRLHESSKQRMWESMQRYRAAHLSQSQGRITVRSVNSGDVNTFLQNCVFCTVGGSARPMRTSTLAARLADLNESAGATGWRNLHAFTANGLGDGRAKWFSSFEGARAAMTSMPPGTLFGVNYWRNEPGHGPVGHTISAEHTPDGIVFTDFQISRIFTEPTPKMGTGQAFQLIPLNNLEHMPETNPADPAFVNETDLSTSDRTKILQAIYGAPFLERTFGATYDVGRVWSIFKQKYHPPKSDSAAKTAQKRARSDSDDPPERASKRTASSETPSQPQTGNVELTQSASQERSSVSDPAPSHQVFNSWNDATNYFKSVPDRTKLVVVPLGSSDRSGYALTGEVEGGRLSLFGEHQDANAQLRFQDAESILVAPIENQAAFCGK